MRQPLAQRLATFDGPVRHVSVTSVVNQNLHSKVEQLNLEIARRLNELQGTGKTKVWHLQCNFKPCADGQVRFIWCSKIAIEQTDSTGFAIEPDDFDSLMSSTLTNSGYSAPYYGPRAQKWDGAPTPCDGSCFHIPSPGMVSFREPSWWGAEKLVGVTNPLAEEDLVPPPPPGLPDARSSASSLASSPRAGGSLAASPRGGGDGFGAAAARASPRAKPTKASKATMPTLWRVDKVQTAIYASAAEPLRARAKRPTPRTHVPPAVAPAEEPVQPPSGTSAEAPAAAGLPAVPGATPRGGAPSSGSCGASPRATDAAALPPLSGDVLPRSMVRAVHLYQTTAQPSGLYTPRNMYTPRTGRAPRPLAGT